MATTICYSRSVVDFRYLFQKIIANPVLGHGMIKLLKPPHAGRIWVRPLHNTCRSELSFNGTEEKFQSCRTVRTSSAKEIYTCEDKIRDLLKSPLHTNLTKLAEDLSNILKHIGRHPEKKGGLVYLYKDILTREHISTMWKIAGYNRTDSADDMLPFKDIQSPVKWGGKSGDIKEGILDRKRKRGDEDLQKPLKQFPLEDEWEMELHRCGNGEAYINVVFKGNSWLFSREKKGRILVDNNLNGIPAGVEPFHLAFVSGADGPWPSSNHFVIYMRAAGPNVLVGQAWAGGENRKRLWAEVVIVKRK